MAKLAKKTTPIEKPSQISSPKKKNPFKGTIIVVAIFLLILGYFYFFEKNQPTDEEKKATPTVSYPLITSLSQDVKSFTITSAQGTLKVELNDKNEWLIKTAKDQVADLSKIESLIKDIDSLQGYQQIDATAMNAKEFSLDPANATITLTTKDGEQTLYVGKKTPATSRYYVSLEKPPVKTIYTTSTTVDGIINKKADDLKWVPPTNTPIPAPTTAEAQPTIEIPTNSSQNDQNPSQ